MAGKQAAAILKGEKKASDMPYETVTEYSTYINSDAASSFRRYSSIGYSRKGNRV